jgi:outer membrane autotransporter protein
MGVVLNPTEQLRGASDFSVITVGGSNGAAAPAIAGVTGDFADSLLDATARFDAATGEVIVTANFGMGHLATAAVSTTAMAQNWWSQTAGSYDKRNMHRLAGANEAGLSVWGAAFHEDGTVKPANGLQDTSFDQKLSGLQTGIAWTVDVGDGSFSLNPMFAYGDARASQNANLGSATGDAWAYGLNASYVLGNGLYFDATWQAMTMDVDFRTPGTLSGATGETDADADGFTVETGYPVRLESGLTFAPQLQYTYVDTELDDFTSSDGVYDLAGMSGKSSLLRAGVSVFRTFETDNGSVTPVANVDYLDETDGEGWLVSNGVSFQNDTSGSGYRVELGLAGRYKGWDITGRVGLTDTTVFDQALSTHVNVRYRW